MSASPPAGRPASLLSNSTWLLAGRVYALATGGALSIYAIRTLSIEDYGQYGTAIAVVGILLLFSEMGLSTLALRRISHEPDSAGEALGAALGAEVATTAVAVLLLVPVGLLLGYGDAVLALLAAGAAIIAFQGLQGPLEAAFTARRRLSLAAAVGAVQSTVTTILGFILLAGGSGPVGLIIAIAAGHLAAVLTAIPLVRGRLQIPVRPLLGGHAIRAFMLAGVPIALTGAVTIVYERLDVLLLSKLDGNAAVARYVVPLTIVQYTLVVPSVVGSAFFPVLSEALRERRESGRAPFLSVARVFLVLSVPIAFVLSLGGEELLRFVFGARYGGSAEALSVLAWTSVAGFANYLLWYALLATYRERSVVVVMLGGLVLNLGLNLALIPPYGIRGAAFGLLASDIAIVAVQAVMVHRRMFRLEPVRLLAKPLVAAVCTAPAILLIPGGLAAGLAAAVIYLAALLILRYVPPEDLRRVTGPAAALLARVPPAGWMVIAAAVALALGAGRAWAGRHGMNTDGIQYLDMGDAWWRGDFGMAVNSYWSPLYSWLTGGLLRGLAPAIGAEFPVVHGLNVVVYALALGAFALMLRELGGGRASAAVRVLCIAVFAWAALSLITIEVVTPDMAVGGWTFLAIALLARLRRGAGLGWWAAFGAVLGLAYLTKAAMLPVGVGLLAVAPFAAGGLRRHLLGAVVAAAMFAAIGAPFAAALSHDAGRPTFGESGRLNYATHIDDVQFYWWHGQPPGYGRPAHPFPQPVATPPVHTFVRPNRATDPAFYDPGYWLEGVKTKVLVGEQLDSVFLSARRFAGLIALGPQVVFLLAWLALWLAGARRLPRLRELLADWWVLGPMTAAVLLYSLVNLEHRYVAAFIAVGWTMLLLRAPTAPEPGRRRFQALAAGSAAAVMALALLAGTVGELRSPEPDGPARVAAAARALGVAPQSRVAVMGELTGPGVEQSPASERATWARLARAQVVAEVNEPQLYWNGSPAARERVARALRAVGATVLVSERPPPRGAEAAGWQPLGAGYYGLRIVSR